MAKKLKPCSEGEFVSLVAAAEQPVLDKVPECQLSGIIDEEEMKGKPQVETQ